MKSHTLLDTYVHIMKYNCIKSNCIRAETPFQVSGTIQQRVKSLHSTSPQHVCLPQAHIDPFLPCYPYPVSTQTPTSVLPRDNRVIYSYATHAGDDDSHVHKYVHIYVEVCIMCIYVCGFVRKTRLLGRNGGAKSDKRSPTPRRLRRKHEYLHVNFIYSSVEIRRG